MYKINQQYPNAFHFIMPFLLQPHR